MPAWRLAGLVAAVWVAESPPG